MNTPAFDLAAREKLHGETIVLTDALSARVQQEITETNAAEMARLHTRIGSNLAELAKN